MKYQPEWVIQAQKEDRHPFFVTMPLNTYHRQGVTSILGLGTAVEKSRTGHKMSQSFVDKLKETSVGKHLFVNHDPNQIAGKITGVKEGHPDEILPIAELLSQHENPVVDAPRAMVEHWINNKVSLGLSFGGTADDVEITQDKDGTYTYNVKDGELMEWSVTPINAVKRSDGSVKSLDPCPGGICQQIATQIQDGPVLPEINKEELKQSNETSLDLDAEEKTIQMKCEACGQFQSESSLYCGNCGEKLPNNKNGNNPIAEQDILGSENMEDERLEKVEQTLEILVQDIKDRKEAEAKAIKEAADKAKIDEAVNAEKAKHAEELKALEETYKESAKEAVTEVLKQIIGDKKGVKQESRHIKESTEEVSDDENLTITQNAAKKMSLEERKRSSVFYPPVVRGKVVEQGYTPEEFLAVKVKEME